MGAIVPAVDAGANLGVEVLDGLEHAAADGLTLDNAEPDLEHVHPGGVGRDEVHDEAWVVLEPGPDVGVLRSPRTVRQPSTPSAGATRRGLENSRDYASGPEAQYAPSEATTALTVRHRIIRSDVMDQFST